MILVLKIYLVTALIVLVAVVIRIGGDPTQLRGKRPFWVVVSTFFFCLVWPYLAYQVIMQVKQNLKVIKKHGRVK